MALALVLLLAMKIPCHCGALIVDQTDALPHKAHLIPDQAWETVWNALDDELIDPLAAGAMDAETAYHHARTLLGRAMRPVYQCRTCGRLYVEDRQGDLQCYAPETPETAKAVLRLGEAGA